MLNRLNRYKLFLRWAIGCLFILFMQCSIDFTGGAGAGNPATIAIIAEGVNPDTLISRPVCSENYVNKNDKNRTLPYDSVLVLNLVDGDNMGIDVDSVFILVNRLLFPAPDSINFEDSVIDPLYYDSNHLILDGPFVFDILHGISVPPINFNLPNGIYKYVTLNIVPNSSDSITSSIDTNFNNFEIIIKGTFTYEDTTRDITIFILCDARVSFFASVDEIELLNENFVELLIELDEKEWLNDVYIKGCIRQGEVTFNEEGHLIIRDNITGQGPSAQLSERIKNNIFSSGIFKRKME